MLARVILALLLAAFALPAMASAPCHDGSQAMPAGMSDMGARHDMPAPLPAEDRKAIAVHACVGCIPPASLSRPAFAAPIRPEAMIRTARLARFDAGLSSPPATPPPRDGA